MIDIIFCCASNRIHSNIAIECGWLYGSQPIGKVYNKVSFTDLDYKNITPEYLELYTNFVDEHRPKYAICPDIFHLSDLDKTVTFALDKLSGKTENIIIVPKICGCIEQLPSELNGTQLMLGYSVPTRYGATEVPLWEFQNDFNIHLLGGSPHEQTVIYRYISNVVSVDISQIQKCARFGKYWCNKIQRYIHTNQRGRFVEEMFRKSCKNIKEFWDNYEKDTNI